MEKRWMSRDHLFEPKNITRYEFGLAFTISRYREPSPPKHILPKVERPGKVKWIMKDGKEVGNDNS